MKGRFRFRVSSKRVIFDFTIRRNITVIKGDSATGKTTLLNMLYEYLRTGRESGFSVSADTEYYVYLRREVGRSWWEAFEPLKNVVIFIEENNDFVHTEEFASYVRNSGNYFVFVNRSPLRMLPYSIHEVFEIVTEKKHHDIKESYHKFRELYSNYPEIRYDNLKKIITEDSNSGFDFFKAAYSDKDLISAGGNANVAGMLGKESNVLAIVDGAAFGAFIEDAIAISESRTDARISLWMPESFEYLILNSGILGNESITETLSDPSGFVESSKYESWEQYFTWLLEDCTRETDHPYKKSRLHPYYTQKRIMEKISDQLPDAIRQRQS